MTNVESEKKWVWNGTTILLFVLGTVCASLVGVALINLYFYGMGTATAGLLVIFGLATVFYFGSFIRFSRFGSKKAR